MSDIATDTWVDGVRDKIDELELYIGKSAANYMRDAASEMISDGRWEELDMLLDEHLGHLQYDDDEYDTWNHELGQAEY